MAVKVKKVEEEVNIKDLAILEAELNGISYQVDGEMITITGLLNQDLLQSVKIHLLDIIEEVDRQKKNYLKLRDELVKKYSDLEDSEQASLFKEEEADLQNQTMTIRLPKFSVDDLFGFKSKYVYPVSKSLLLDRSLDE